MKDEELKQKIEKASDSTPIWAAGVPLCQEDEATCHQYDGKRCRLQGCRPNFVCRPAIEQMAKLLGLHK
jgi:hypothetical protein